MRKNHANLARQNPIVEGDRWTEGRAILPLPEEQLGEGESGFLKGVAPDRLTPLQGRHHQNLDNRKIEP